MTSDPMDQNQHAAGATGAEGLDAEAARFLASLQQRLSKVQSTAADLKSREAALADQERALAEQQSSAAAQAAAAEAKLREAAQVAAQADARVAAAKELEEAAAQAAREFDERKAKIDREEAEAAAQCKRLLDEARAAQERIENQAKSRAEEMVAAAEKTRAELAARRAELDRATEQAVAKTRELEQHAKLADARSAELAREQEAVAEQVATIEKTVASLAQREQRLSAAERRLEDRETAANGLAELAARRAKEHSVAVASLERDRAAAEQRRADVERQERSVKAAKDELDALQQTVSRAKTDLQQRETALLNREQQLRTATEELERRRIFVSQCEAQASQLEATSRHLREQAEQIKVSSERQVAQWQDKATEAQFQSDSAQQQVQKLQEQLSAAQARARALEEEMDQVKVLGVTISPEAQARVDALSRRAETAEQRAATLQEIIDQHSDEVAKAEARFDAVARQLEEVQRALGSAGDDHGKQLEAWREQGERYTAQLAAAQGAAQEARAAAERSASEVAQANSRLQQAESRADAMARRAEAAEAAAHKSAEELRKSTEAAAARTEAGAGEESERAVRRAAELEAQLKKRDAELAELRTKAVVADAGDGADGFNAEQRRKLEAELAQREEALRVLANRLLNSEERTLAMQAQLDKFADEVADWEERAENGQVSSRSVETAPVQSNASPEVVISDSRRRRLRRVRELLGQEHRKVLLAKEALSRHKAEADAVLQQRARLSQLAQNLQAAEAEAIKARAKSGAGSVLVAAMITLVAVTGLCYLGAGVVYPSTYAARATVAAANEGRAPTEQQARVWTAAHERLATDLQVYTLAAENFQQRGMRELATPAAVQDRFANSLAVLADSPSQITFELRGTGRENTARELETFVGAVSAIANSRREVRQDGMGTTVIKQAEAGKDPLDNRRQTAMFAAIGAGLVAAAAAGYAAFAMLARVRKPQAGTDPLDAFTNSPLARLTADNQGSSSNAAA